MEIEDKLDYIFVLYSDQLLGGYYLNEYMFNSKFPTLLSNSFGWNINTLKINNRIQIIENYYKIKLKKSEYKGCHYKKEDRLLHIPNKLIKYFIKEIEMIKQTNDRESQLYIIETIKFRLNEYK